MLFYFIIFSSKQRQLIGLARAILKQSPLILIEKMPDLFIKTVICRNFPNSTIIVIDDDVHTAMNYDKFDFVYVIIKFIMYLKMLNLHDFWSKKHKFLNLIK